MSINFDYKNTRSSLKGVLLKMTSLCVLFHPYILVWFSCREKLTAKVLYFYVVVCTWMFMNRYKKNKSTIDVSPKESERRGEREMLRYKKSKKREVCMSGRNRSQQSLPCSHTVVCSPVGLSCMHLEHHLFLLFSSFPWNWRNDWDTKSASLL